MGKAVVFIVAVVLLMARLAQKLISEANALPLQHHQKLYCVHKAGSMYAPGWAGPQDVFVVFFLLPRAVWA